MRRELLSPVGCDVDEQHTGWPDPAKERRCTEILNAAEAIANARSWDAFQACRDTLARAVQRGVSDSSIQSDVGDSRVVPSVFWAFIHGVLQSSMAKTSIPARTHITGAQLIEQALSMARRAMQGETAQQFG